jgi:hypothetical protein
MIEARLGQLRTFRWNDGESTDGYHGVDIGPSGARYFTWSHRQGEGRIERGEQSLDDLLADGPLLTPPGAVAEQLRAEARRWLED